MHPQKADDVIVYACDVSDNNACYDIFGAIQQPILSPQSTGYPPGCERHLCSVVVGPWVLSVTADSQQIDQFLPTTFVNITMGQIEKFAQ